MLYDVPGLQSWAIMLSVLFALMHLMNWDGQPAGAE